VPASDNPALANSVSYLSLVTLTSTGFGDIVPVHPIARSLCNIESIIGQLYPATLLARLVTLEMRERSSIWCPLLALSGHSGASDQCPLSGVKRTWLPQRKMSA